MRKVFAFDLFLVLCSSAAFLLLFELLILLYNRCITFWSNIVLMSCEIYHCTDNLIRLLNSVVLLLYLLRLYNLLKLLLRLLLIVELLLLSLLKLRIGVTLLIKISFQAFEYITSSLWRFCLLFLLTLNGILTLLKFFFSDQCLKVNNDLGCLTLL